MVINDGDQNGRQVTSVCHFITSPKLKLVSF
jgi:hypothetical protein